MKIINVPKIVCQNCGTVLGYQPAKEFIDFYENRCRITEKSIYHRKYHVENILNSVCQKHGIEISYLRKQRIYNIFKLIDRVLPQVNNDHKRMISIKFILRQIFRVLGIEYKFIPLSKSKKTLKYYKTWGYNAYGLVMNDIGKFINK